MNTPTTSTPTISPTESYDVIVVGAGFGGLYALYRLRRLGLSVRVIEAGPSVGGTWYWNRYPGARCDVESIDYSYSFDEDLQQEWTWSERYASQPEILRYIEHVADRFDLRRDVTLGTRVTAARYDDASSRWHVSTDTGRSYVTRYCVMAVGNLTALNTPSFPGLNDFQGSTFHTARWPEEPVDFTGMRVGVIGTGSTGIQVIPQIAEQAAELFVFQRTANFSMPARNRPLTPDELEAVKATYRERREKARWSFAGIPVDPATSSAHAASEEERRAAYDAGWQAGGAHALISQFADGLIDRVTNEFAADYARDRIREIVEDPEVAETLCPDHPLGSKRICVDTHYYEVFNRPNVTLVDLREAPIDGFDAHHLRTATMAYELDAVVFATGFDAITGALLAIDIRGRDGIALREAWSGGPGTYLGVGISGFPNLFVVTGPFSPAVQVNVIMAIEQHVDWVADCIAHLDEHGFIAIEPTPEAQHAWVRHVGDVAAGTLRSATDSWWSGANVPGKPRVFMPYAGGLGAFRQICDDVAARGYDGFALSNQEARGDEQREAVGA
jgi:cyclohexanone monooxygenase